MTQKLILAPVVFVVLLGLTGCPANEKTALSDGDKKFTLTSDKEVSVTQGGVATVNVTATRTGFEEDVRLTVADLPPGVKVAGADSDLLIPRHTKQFKVTLEAAPDAKPTTAHKATVEGQSGKFDAKNTLTVSVTEKTKPVGDQLEKKREEAKVWYEARKKEFDNQITNLQKRADAAAGETKTKINAAIRDLRDRKAKLDETYERVKDQTASAWDEFYAGLQRAGRELSDATRKALDEYK